MLHGKRNRTERKNVRKKPFPDVAGYFWLITDANEQIVQVVEDKDGFPTEYLNFKGERNSVFDHEGAEWLNVMRPEDLLLKPRKEQGEKPKFDRERRQRPAQRPNSGFHHTPSISSREEERREEEHYQSLGNVAIP